MSVASHQTIRLSRGPHDGADDGACVMELASMLAGEPFSDHPACVSPVLASFLRTYNDLVDDRHRQSLYRFAALVVGTRGGDDLEAAHGKACTSWIAEILADPGHGRWRRWVLASTTWGIKGGTAEARAIAAGRLAARLARQRGDAGHAEIEAFLERLVVRAVARSARLPVTGEAVTA